MVDTSKEREKMEAVCKKVINLMGSGSALSKELGLHKSSVYHWKVVPAEHVVFIAELLQKRNPGKPVPGIFEMRPDVFGTPARLMKQLPERYRAPSARRRGGQG